MNKPKLLLTLLTALIHISLQSQTSSSDNKLGLLFYNVENLFDIYNDSIKNDEEFLPDGVRRWNYTKYNQKLQHISRVIYESGKYNPPDIIGLCEVENSRVLHDLIKKTGLHNLSYKVIHFESEDLRGIDCALLYQSNNFIPLESNSIKIKLGDNNRPTRDILYTYGIYRDSIPLHLFVCHFPSRYGGVMETKAKRYRAAQALTDTIQCIYQSDKMANIIVMGDFNDNPSDSCMTYIVNKTGLINLASNPASINKSNGTLKHQFEWNIFDQFLISNNSKNKFSHLSIVGGQKILDFKFLMEEDSKYTGIKPFRTYLGYKYNKGYSDHFPIWLSLQLNTKE